MNHKEDFSSVIIYDYNDFHADEYDSDIEELEYENSIDVFLNNNYYNIILLLEDIKSYFFYNNPDFLCKLNSDRLTNIIIELIFYDTCSLECKEFDDLSLKCKEFDALSLKCKEFDFDLNDFIHEFENEINTSYNIINKFLKQFHYSMDQKTWTKICRKYTYYSKHMY